MAKWTVLVVVIVAACRKTEGPRSRSAANDRGSAAPVATDAAVIPDSRPAELPANGIANSAIESVPRKDWPCRYVQTLDSVAPRGTHIATRWVYGKRAHCWIPADVAGSRGVFGCPDKEVGTNLENHVQMVETYSYDAGDHLTDVQTMAATFEYAWDGNLVRGYTLRDETHPFLATDSGVEIKDGADTIRVDVDKNGHVVKYQRIGSLELKPTVFTWKGSRLAGLDQIGTTKIEYDCKSPPQVITEARRPRATQQLCTCALATSRTCRLWVLRGIPTQPEPN